VKRVACLFAATLFGLALCRIAAAQESDMRETPAPADGDRAVVATIVMDAVTEVKLCGLAIEKSQNADVRLLCRKASADNARTAIAGMQLAQTLGATDVKLQPSPDTPAVLDSLAQYSGREFDREFLLGQIEADENDEHTIRYAAEFALDTSVKQYENSLLPKVEKHLDSAESALRRVSEAAP
jgi:predicted outer membrane protein